MSTHATASKHWTETELDELTVERKFRLRGLEVTRLDTFIDAAFAFVLTLLVISFDKIPSTYHEMMDAVKHIPGFAASFTIVMMFWLQHRTWSRRFGLENVSTIALSLGLIFVLLVYVYPLKTMFEGMFAQWSGGYLVASYRIGSAAELRGMLIFYSVGFFAMSLVVCRLHHAALQNASQLGLNAVELRTTRVQMWGWAIATAFGAAAALLASVLPENLARFPGYLYFVLIPATLLPRFWLRR